jgi:hypothetical protein
MLHRTTVRRADLIEGTVDSLVSGAVSKHLTFTSSKLRKQALLRSSTSNAQRQMEKGTRPSLPHYGKRRRQRFSRLTNLARKNDYRPLKIDGTSGPLRVVEANLQTTERSQTRRGEAAARARGVNQLGSQEWYPRLAGKKFLFFEF